MKKAELSVERKKLKPRAKRPRLSGRAPQAMVTARHGVGTLTRPGRGFSIGELSGGGLAPRLAAKWGVSVDFRRRSVLDGNVSSLKAWNTPTGMEAEADKDAHAAEREVSKAVKAVEHEVAAAKKETVKAEKAVKKDVREAEAAVKKKTTKRKAPAKKKA